VIDESGQASKIIFNLGPGRLGDLVESIAIPEIRQQAVELASTLADRVGSQYVLAEKIVTGIGKRELVGEWAAA
jgi:hydroxyacylglutathione hydrolase